MGIDRSGPWLLLAWLAGLVSHYHSKPLGPQCDGHAFHVDSTLMKDLHPLQTRNLLLFAPEMNFDPTDGVTFDLNYAPATGHGDQVIFGSSDLDGATLYFEVTFDPFGYPLEGFSV